MTSNGAVVTTATTELARSVEQIPKFSGVNLASTITKVESEIFGRNKRQIAEWLTNANMDARLVESAKAIKRTAAQIDVVLHVLGILFSLPTILEEGEIVESLSLGAGSSKSKRFDVETNRRIAEFTFIDWTGNDNMRLQKVFKDFYRLAEFATSKSKELWVTDDSYVLKYLRSGASVRSATHKQRDIWEDFQAKYPLIEKIGEYYRLRGSSVQLKVFKQSTIG